MSEKSVILITGSQGFIGSILIRRLRQAGYDVRGVDLVADTNNQVLAADLLNTEDTHRVLQKAKPFSVLIHAAAIAHGQQAPPGESCVTINTKVTANILEAIGKESPRLIFLSSVAVYGEDGRHAAVKILDDLRPSTDYGRSKLLCEKHIMTSNLDHFDILRLAPVYDKSYMINVRKRVFLPGPFKIKMRFCPSPKYSLCHVSTVVQRVLNLIEEGSKGRYVHNIADPEKYDQNQIASWFSGCAVPVPVAFFRPFYWVATLLPRKTGYAFRCLYWKLFQSNLYEIDTEKK